MSETFIVGNESGILPGHFHLDSLEAFSCGLPKVSFLFKTATTTKQSVNPNPWLSSNSFKHTISYSFQYSVFILSQYVLQPSSSLCGIWSNLEVI